MTTYLGSIKETYVHNIHPSVVKVKNSLSKKMLAIVNKITNFIDKNFSGIFFGVSALGTLYFAPNLFLVGVVTGLVGSRLWESTNKKNIDVATNNIRLVNPLKAALENVGCVGAALTYSYPANYMLLFPLGGGIVAGNFLYNAYRKCVPIKP